MSGSSRVKMRRQKPTYNHLPKYLANHYLTSSTNPYLVWKKLLLSSAKSCALQSWFSRFSQDGSLKNAKMKNQPPEIHLTKNFRLSEFACHDGTAVPSDLLKNVNALAFNLQVLREHINRPIVILSGYRTLSHNKLVGGAPHSQHLLARAADIQVKGLSPYAIARIIEDLISEDFMKQGGIGIYDTFTHYDIRGFRSRWDYRSK